jgi:hypothetical protein
MTGHQPPRVPALVVSALICLSGLWFGAQDLFGYAGNITVAGFLSIVMAVVTFAFVGLRLVRRQSSQTWQSWSLFILMAAAGYLVGWDGFSNVLYRGRPDGFPDSCYTLLEMWLKTPQGSWTRGAEQIAAVAVFFGSPLALLVGKPEPRREPAVNGA